MVQLYCGLFKHLSTEGHLCCFWFLAIINVAGVNIHSGFGAGISVHVCEVNTPPQRAIPRSCGICLFRFIRNCQTIFQI